MTGLMLPPLCEWVYVSISVQEPFLKALQFLPDIITLQKVLTTHFNLKIDRNESQNQVTIRSAIADVTAAPSGKVLCITTYSSCMKLQPLLS